MHSLYSVICWGQCSEAMQAKIKSEKLHDSMQEVDDSLMLIKMIKGIAYKFESQKNIYLALNNVKCAYYAYKQGPDETNANYMSKFKNTIEVIDHYGGTIGEDKALVLKELKSARRNNETTSAKEIETATDLAKRKMHTIAFLKRSDKGRYGQLITDLENQFTRSTDQYPTSVTEVFNLLVNYKKPTAVRERNNRQGYEGNGNAGSAPAQKELTFVQQANAEPPIEIVQCYNCQQMGHYARGCELPCVQRGRNTGVQRVTCKICTRTCCEKCTWWLLFWHILRKGEVVIYYSRHIYHIGILLE